MIAVAYFDPQTRVVSRLLRATALDAMPDPMEGELAVMTDYDQGLPAYVDGLQVLRMPEKPSGAAEWSGETLSWATDLEALRQATLKGLKRSRDAVEFSQFTYAGHVLDGHAEAQRRLATLASVAKTAIAAGFPFTKEFTLADNSVVEFTAEDFVGIEMAKIWQVEAAFTKYRTLRAQADAATTVEELEAIAWD